MFYSHCYSWRMLADVYEKFENFFLLFHSCSLSGRDELLLIWLFLNSFHKTPLSVERKMAREFSMWIIFCNLSFPVESPSLLSLRLGFHFPQNLLAQKASEPKSTPRQTKTISDGFQRSIVSQIIAASTANEKLSKHNFLFGCIICIFITRTTKLYQTRERETIFPKKKRQKAFANKVSATFPLHRSGCCGFVVFWENPKAHLKFINLSCQLLLLMWQTSRFFMRKYSLLNKFARIN